MGTIFFFFFFGGGGVGGSSLFVEDPYGVSLWKFIRWGWSTFSRFLQFDVGNGPRVKFWHDVWCGDCPLRAGFPELFKSNKQPLSFSKRQKKIH